MQFLCTGNNRTRTEEYVVGSRKFLIIIHQHYPNLRLANIRIQNEYSLLQFTIEYDCWLNSCKENFAGGLKPYSQYNEL